MLKEDNPHNDIACEANDELDHFVRALSHDMNANFMLLESSFAKLKKFLCDKKQPPGDIVSHVDACLGQSKQFLEDLVQLGKTGKVQMEPDCVDVSDVINEVLFELHELLSQRDVCVEVAQPLSVVWCNKQRLKQIITNLIRNALKHGCDLKEPKISISQPPMIDNGLASEQEGFVDLHVQDNGAGITPGFEDEIFLPGFRLSTAAGDGSGMGLAIVKKIVLYYGGSVWIDQSAGKGMCVVVSLPHGLREEKVLKQLVATQNVEHDGPHQVKPPARRNSPSFNVDPVG